MKARDVVRILEERGFRPERQRGSHRQFAGYVAGKRHLVTVAGTDGDDVSKGTLSSIKLGLPGKAFR